MVKVLQAMELDCEAVFLDLGSGHGVPVFLAAYAFGCKKAIGVELGSEAFKWAEETRQSYALTHPAFHAVEFKHMNIFDMKDVLGATHIYSCDAAFPPALRLHIAFLLNTSTSWKFFATTTRPKFWNQELNILELIASIPAQMGVSGEQHTIYIFTRRQ
jgi:hypothetical protein